MPLPQYSMILSKKTQLSNNTVQLDFEFERGGSAEFNYTAGQFIQLLIPTKEKVRKRSYSLAGSPESFQHSGQLEIAISHVDGGLASELFRCAETGLPLQLSGPFGMLTLPEDIPGQLVLVGTGTGIAPYRSMIPGLQQLADKGVPVSVIMGARYRQDLIYAEDFISLNNVNYRVCLSREAEIDSQNHEYSGYVQQQFSALNLNPDTDLVYLCGNPGMIDDAAAALKLMGFPPRQVKREKYVFSGH